MDEMFSSKNLVKLISYYIHAQCYQNRLLPIHSLRHHIAGSGQLIVRRQVWKMSLTDGIPYVV